MSLSSSARGSKDTTTLVTATVRDAPRVRDVDADAATLLRRDRLERGDGTADSGTVCDAAVDGVLETDGVRENVYTTFFLRVSFSDGRFPTSSVEPS
jgi:hypothetical protein